MRASVLLPPPTNLSFILFAWQYPLVPSLTLIARGMKKSDRYRAYPLYFFCVYSKHTPWASFLHALFFCWKNPRYCFFIVEYNTDFFQFFYHFFFFRYFSEIYDNWASLKNKLIFFVLNKGCENYYYYFFSSLYLRVVKY